MKLSTMGNINKSVFLNRSYKILNCIRMRFSCTSLRWNLNETAGYHLTEPFPVPTTSISRDSKYCILVYKLPSNALVNNPLDSVLEFNIFRWSTLILEDEELEMFVESTDCSAKSDSTFPVLLFQTWIVPSQDATLPLDDNTQMSFTTCKFHTN